MTLLIINAVSPYQAGKSDAYIQYAAGVAYAIGTTATVVGTATTAIGASATIVAAPVPSAAAEGPLEAGARVAADTRVVARKIFARSG